MAGKGHSFRSVSLCLITVSQLTGRSFLCGPPTKCTCRLLCRNEVHSQVPPLRPLWLRTWAAEQGQLERVQFSLCVQRVLCDQSVQSDRLWLPCLERRPQRDPVWSHIYVAGFCVGCSACWCRHDSTHQQTVTPVWAERPQKPSQVRGSWAAL